MEKALRRTYYNLSNPSSYSGVTSIYKHVRKKFPKIKVSDVEKFLSRQKTYALHKAIRRNFPRKKITAVFLDSHWQADLCDMQKLSRQNKKYRFLLTVVDVLSKYGFAIPVLNKEPTTIKEAFDGILKKTGRKCFWLYTDAGKEFVGKPFKKYLDSQDIIHRVASSDVKCPNVERYNRTLKTKLWKYFYEHETKKYLDVLQDIVDSINNTYKESIGCAPSQVTKANEMEIRDRLFGTKNTFKPKMQHFEAGDRVHISKYKNIFDKGYLPNYTSEIFIVKSCEKGNPPTYRLKDQIKGEDVDGLFYNQELIMATD